MAWTIDAGSPAPASVAGLLEFACERIRDPSDYDQVAQAAPLLLGLAQDRKLVLEALNRDLAHVLAGKGRLFYSQQSLILAEVERRFTVRANIWPTITSAPRSRAVTERVFAYTVPHDHNFSFLTVGYLGPGYETAIYEYDFTRVEGRVGEPVELRFLETTRLTPGKVMLFRSGRDVHIQYAPRELSMSLNLLVYSAEDMRREQFAFDVSGARISGLLAQSGVTNIVDLLGIATAVGGDERTLELVLALAARHLNRSVRLGAAQAACVLSPALEGRVWGALLSDPEPSVAREARQRIALLEHGRPP
jgi:hypothetical protein